MLNCYKIVLKFYIWIYKVFIFKATITFIYKFINIKYLKQNFNKIQYKIYI